MKILSVEEFKQVVADRLISYLPKEYQGNRVLFRTVDKNNGSYEGITLDRDAAPIVSVQDMHAEYIKGKPLDRVLTELAGIFVREAGYCRKCKELASSLKLNKSKIYLKLVNTKMNEERLQSLVHREFLDLSITYRILIDWDERGMASTAVTKNLAESWGMTEQEFFELAVKNTPKLFPPVIMPISQVNPTGGNSDDDACEDDLMHVVTTEKMLNGSSAILYEDLIHGHAERFGSNLYILPSSTEDLILLPEIAGMDERYLSFMVREVNMLSVAPQEVLSDSVYYYDRQERTIRILNAVVCES